MIKLYWYREAVNLSIIITMLVFYLCLKYAIAPSLRAGFFCDDFSITLPHKDSETVNDLWLHIILIAIPVLIIVGTELTRLLYARVLNRNRSSSNRKSADSYLLVLPFGKKFKIWDNFGNAWIILEFFFFGLLTDVILTFLPKVIIGRLRPHFLSLCKPKQDPFALCARSSIRKFLVPGVDFECATPNSELIDARRSFPSGHASSTFYAMMFLIFYVHKYWTKRELTFLTGLFKAFFFGIAMMTALSRVSDNMHHATDVIAGTVLGVLVAVGTIQCVRVFYARSDPRRRLGNDINNNNQEDEENPEAEKFVELKQQSSRQKEINLPAIEIKYDL